jgi:hypothetical protein
MAAAAIGCGPIVAEPIAFDDSKSTLDVGLVGYWKLDEREADGPVLDSSELGNHGVSVNSPTPSSQGAPVRIANGGSREFNGVDQLVDLGNPASLNFEGEITLAAWVLADDVGRVCQTLLGHGFRFGPAAEVSLRRGGGACATSGATPTWAIGAYDGIDHFAQAPLLESDLGGWIHLVGTYDGRSWHLFRNGLEVALLVDTLGAFALDAAWGLGGRAATEPSGERRSFSGRMDEVRIYRRALSAPEVLRLYQL